MQAGVILYNRSRHRPFTISLYHSIMCTDGCQCARVPVPGTLRHMRLERSLTIAPKTASEVLPEAVLRIPQVRRAMEGVSPWLVQMNKTAEVVYLEP